MTARTIIVLGAESTATRLTTRILINAGCAGSDQHAQPFDKTGPGGAPLTVWRRSVPHCGQVPNIAEMLVRCTGRDVSFVCTFRDWECTAKSQVKNRHVPSLNAFPERLQTMYANFLQQVFRTGRPFFFLIYEALILQPVPTQKALLEALGLPLPTHYIPIQNMNDKWRTA